MLASILIPVGPYHTDMAQRAVDSARAQTLTCDVRLLHDVDSRGAGWCRNQLATGIDSLFCIFLDADDELRPDFIERCVEAYQPGKYLYTDWFEDGVRCDAPDCDAWVNTTVRPHLVTTLLPTMAFRQVGGFDEQLPGFEDADFYLKLRTFGWCGKRVKRPLMHYHGDGQRSEAFKQNPQRVAIRTNTMNRWKDQLMGCGGGCGDVPTPQADSSERQLGDVLAKTLYPPATQFGLGGRFYRRQLYMGQEIWVAPRDVQAFPQRWQLVRDPSTEAPDVETVMALAQAGLAK